MHSITNDFLINTYISFVAVFLITWVLVLLNASHTVPYIYLSLFIFYLTIYLYRLLLEKLNS